MYLTSVRPKPNIRPKISAKLAKYIRLKVSANPPNIRPLINGSKCTEYIFVKLCSKMNSIWHFKVQITHDTVIQVKLSSMVEFYRIFFSFLSSNFGRIFGRKFRPLWPNIRFRPKLGFPLSVVHYSCSRALWSSRWLLFLKHLLQMSHLNFLTFS